MNEANIYNVNGCDVNVNSDKVVVVLSLEMQCRQRLSTAIFLECQRWKGQFRE
jgi:hypothetical protein